METENVIDALAALAQETRLAIFRLLVKAGSDGLPAGDIADRVGGRQNTTSSHLAILSRAGLIAGERDGRSIIYRAQYLQIASLIGYLLEDCCDGRAEVCAPLLSTLSCLNPNAAGACCD